MLKKRNEVQDFGPSQFDSGDKDQEKNRLLKRLAELG
jgi:hypothetical protein